VFRSYAFENRRRFGSMIVHFAVVVVAVSVMAASAYRVDMEARLDRGVPFEFHGYELTLVEVFEESLVGEARAGAEVEVSRNGRTVKTLRPMLKQFAGQSMTVPTPGVHYTATQDIYLNVGGNLTPGQDHVIMHIVRSPFVTWIWVGGVLLVFGTAYCLLPSAAERRAAATVAGAEGTVRA
ncbi:MAG TPA: cytochrome c-type biogenesis CcmF C-terminal domain-containing protein, partial [Deinococcales bacterium]|nr:cytochrome c-type biogenesis CcmF C-terminal domain-containing protein [Deinococcales bacterium]